MSSTNPEAEHSDGPVAARDAGVSLVEVLVGMGLFGLLGSILLGFAIGTSRVSEDTRSLAGVNDETRLAMERLTRELRQANDVLTLELPATATDATALTFWTDFDGDRVEDRSVVDPEVLTYRWRPADQELTLTADDASGTAVTRPMLAANVTAFTLDLYSSKWEHDGALDGTADGKTSWQEIDAAIGDADSFPDPDELEYVDLIDVSMTVSDGSHLQTFDTQIHLRNRNQN